MLIRRQLLSIPNRMLVSLADAKNHIAETSTSRDAIIRSVILAAYNHIGHITGRALLTEKWRIFHTQWGTVNLPKGQLQSVESVKYLDEDGTEHTVDPGSYEVVGIGGDRAYIVFADGFGYPDLYDHEPVRVEFTAGWEDASRIPEEITLAALFYVEMVIADSGDERFVDGFLTNHILEWF